MVIFLTACGSGSVNSDTSTNSIASQEANASTNANNDTNTDINTDINTEVPNQEDTKSNDISEQDESIAIEENSTNTIPVVDVTNEEVSQEISESTEHLGKAQLGVLSKATVKLYELTGLERKLLASTVTSEGDSIESIGNFNLYLEKLEDDKLYLYEVSGGEDFDVNDDGIIDNTSTTNKGTFHLVVLGSHIKALEEAKVTVVSEIIYQKLLSSLTLSVTDIVSLMQSIVKEVVREDINGDGFVGIEDMLKFDPVNDKNKLQERYAQSISTIIDDILKNQNPDYTAPVFLNSETSIQVNENVPLVYTVNVMDTSDVSIVLTGVDATQFSYNRGTKELAFVSPVDFESPLDSNGDNVFELIIQATDTYQNSSSQAFSIEVLDVNETLPEKPELEDSNFSLVENSNAGTLIGTVTIKKVGTSEITEYLLSGEDAKLFSISEKGEIFAQESFNYETKNSYKFQVAASNSIGTSELVHINVQVTNIADVKPVVANANLFIYENRPIGTVLGLLNIWDIGDSNITKYTLYGELDNDFKINADGQVETLSYLNYDSKVNYKFEYTAHNDAGESQRATLKIQVRRIKDNTESNNTNTEVTQYLGKAQLGVLSKANVKLYELTGLERKLLASTVTSEGDSIESIGNFNLYLEKLEDEKLYLYEVNGGEDFDVNDDGIIEDVPTTNKGTFHLMVLGSDLKAMKEAKVTAVSEIIYQRLLSSFTLPVTDIVSLMQSIVKEVIREDINGDGLVGIEDMLKFDPVNDKNKLQERYTQSITTIRDDILNNQSSDYTAPVFSNTETTIQVNENLTLLNTLNITDTSEVAIVLTGVDAAQFTYNTDTKELAFVSPVDFENPSDSNGDNIFELIIQATDSYQNSSSHFLSIAVLDVDESISEKPELEDTTFSISENNDKGAFIGTVSVKKVGTSEITEYLLSGEDAKLFSISEKGQIFAQESFNYETKNSYQFQVAASNSIGTSELVHINVQVSNIADVKPIVTNAQLTIDENRPIGTLFGVVNILDYGDSNITHYSLYGVHNDYFKITVAGHIQTTSYLDYESINSYEFEYTAHNDAGESEKATLNITVNNVNENSGPNYPKTEDGIQSALDNQDYSYVISQLLNNRASYTDLNDDEMDMNIAAAYVGSSGYTVFDILGAMSNGNTNSFNDFVNNITKENNAVETISQLQEADTYYSKVTEGLDCTNTGNLTEVEKNSCYNLGLVRLSSLTNSVKLLFGGEEETVQKWASGVQPNSADDFNGNGVLDNAEASACAIIYASNSQDNCQNGTLASYKAKVTFNKKGKSHDLTLIEVDVGNASNGYQSFYQLVSRDTNNRTPILTSGTCDVNFNVSAGSPNGTSLFPCPTLDKAGEVMGIKQNLEQAANVQDLFPDGDQTKTTIESYLSNITGSSDGTIGLDNLSTYLKRN